MNPALSGCEYLGLTSSNAPGPARVPGDTIVETGDAGATVGSAAAMTVGTYFLGELSSGTESDWIEVTLDPGTYTIAGVGTGPLDSAVNDITLTLRDVSGVSIDYDNGSGPGLNAELSVTTSETMTLFIDVGSYVPTDSGTYGVSITEGSLASYNAEMGAGNLMRSNQAWVSSGGTSVDLTWAVRASGTDPLNGTPMVALDASQIALADAALSYTDAISGLNVTRVAPDGSSNDATLLIGAYSANDGAGAYAYLPGSNGGNTSSPAANGDIWLNNQSFGWQSYGFGTYTSFTMLHEIGHAIGLAHPGTYNASSGVTFSYQNHAQFTEDSQQYTVMSYFDETHTGASGGLGFPDTFMLHDFMAIHQLYGTDDTYNAGNTIYGFNATEAGSAYDFTANATPFMTVYDGAGSDTIDLSGYANGQRLTLEAGSFSDIGGYSGNFSIAFGAVIEHAVGGSGNDEITGNSAPNQLEGGAGADTLIGSAGNDTLIGGEGNDTLMGGAEFDLLEGGEGRDSLVGGMGNDTLVGGRQNDRMSGGNGDDIILGEMGADRLIGGRGADTLSGGNRNDKLIGGDGDDDIFGDQGNDLLRGGSQNDALHGGAGNDILVGGAGFDTLEGGDGDDSLTGAFNADLFIFKDANGADTISDFDAQNDFEKIDFSGMSSLNTLSDVLGHGSGTAAATQVDADVFIATDGGSILLQNVLYADLDAQDFIF
ncbi:M10 family metallopeptidase C-terminal domain-containing protein [Gymnodinialimonas ceratoperidinii]|uniref:M10 family metallopeptidase C-terminal domain-containing protein n=1 Tax=Gymnodinialimonas ceratoperidinii TaxID=2856823 RepID=A0A8F6YCD0_9RHOB|nr:M10 family metallopeptidase C-terminal domain-containing protein [Gymnodinialimonas ceratoperidinii]QXT41106.1 M10 family metallopeptidase C-terminal domain-containing protein [Gymnodinialimonas ceratoperidinii]